MKFYIISSLAVFLIGAQALVTPVARDSLSARADECPPRITVVESCFECADRQWERCGEPDETGQRICYCTTCQYACFLDLVEKREPEPIPVPFAEPAAEANSKRVASPQLDEVCPPSTAVVEGCSKCKYGFTNKLACQEGSTGLECRCNVCFNFCTYDGPTTREADPVPVPPPENICPAAGSPAQSCSLCGAGFDRCAANGLCQCRFCDGSSSFCQNTPKEK